MLELMNYNLSKEEKIITTVRFINLNSKEMEHIDLNNKKIILNKEYFDNHPIWGNIKEEIIDGQYMIRIPKFYFKNENHKKISISETKLSGFKCHPAFMKNGVEQPYFWVGKYQGYVQNNKLCSISDIYPTTNLSFNKIKTYITNRNVNGITGFCMPNIYMISAIQMLYLVEYADTNSQNVLGEGVNNSSSFEKVDSTKNLQAAYRNICGLYGNLWQCIDGLECINGKLNIIDNYGNGTFQNTQILLPIFKGPDWDISNSGFINSMYLKEDINYNLNDIFFPLSWVSKDSDSIYHDGFFGTNSTLNSICLYGGAYGTKQHVGIFCYYFHTDKNSSASYIGTRLAKI